MYLISELISEVPGLQEGQYRILINHTSLLSSVLSYCSVPRHRHEELNSLLHKITVRMRMFNNYSCKIRKILHKKIKTNSLLLLSLPPLLCVGGYARTQLICRNVSNCINTRVYFYLIFFLCGSLICQRK